MYIFVDCIAVELGRGLQPFKRMDLTGLQWAGYARSLSCGGLGVQFCRLGRCEDDGACRLNACIRPCAVALPIFRLCSV